MGTSLEKVGHYNLFSIANGVLKRDIDKRQRIGLHRLVFVTFCDEKVTPWMHQGDIDYINRNKADNRFVILRYATAKENNNNTI